MSTGIPNSPRRNRRSFQKVVDAFLSADGLPFAEILSAERIERIFVKHGCLFGLHGVYTTAIMVWSFLSQVLRDGKEASCQRKKGVRNLFWPVSFFGRVFDHPTGHRWLKRKEKVPDTFLWLSTSDPRAVEGRNKRLDHRNVACWLPCRAVPA